MVNNFLVNVYPLVNMLPTVKTKLKAYLENTLMEPYSSSFIPFILNVHLLYYGDLCFHFAFFSYTACHVNHLN